MNSGIVKVSRETKGRKGKGVTLIFGVPLHPDGLRELAKEFKQCCGSGGTVKAGVIEIQGDHREALMELLIQKGYRANRPAGRISAGGSFGLTSEVFHLDTGTEES